jgi:hypothetical protein
MTRLLLVFFAIGLLLSSQSANAAVQTTSGVTQPFGNTLTQGTTSYAVYYSFPSEALVGQNLTIALTLHVLKFSGVLEYISGYSLGAQVFIGSDVLSSTKFGPEGNNQSGDFLYPGGYWGPINFTFPLTEANTGLATGDSANATLSINLQDVVYWGVPALTYETEPAMQADGGSFLIENGVASSTAATSTVGQGGGQTLLPYALVASGAILMVAAVFLPRRPPMKSEL